jgi:uncharacterized protein YcfJ
MKKVSILIALISLSVSPFEDSYSQEVYVVSSQPRFVTTNQRQCNLETIRVDNGQSGALIGGIAGGVIGNQLGKGSSRDTATAVGVVTGAMVGNRVGQDQIAYETREVCRTIPVTIERGEIVTFSYRGRVFTHIFE